MDTGMVKQKKKKTTSGQAPLPDEFRVIPEDELDWDLYEKNMDAFQKHNSRFARQLKTVTAPQSRLIKNDEGEYDIQFHGTRLYGKGAQKWSEERMDNFESREGIHQLLINPPDSANLDDESNVTGYRILNRSIRSGVSFLTAPATSQCYHLVVFGIGLGLHLPEITEKTACRHIVCVEPNLEFAYHSLFVFDWDAFLEGLDSESRHYSFIANETSVDISEGVRDSVRFVNPAFVDGILFFRTYPSSLMSAAVDILIKDRDTIGTGLGFLEDEIDMVRNSYQNLVNFEGKHYKDTERMLSIPVFVVGGGPSIDKDLAYIRENQHRAIVISCGTALRVLLKNGIMPDFQMEMENVIATSEVMKILADEYDLSSITLIASSTVDPGACPFFSNTVFYFRSTLASYPLFYQGDDTRLSYATPTVTNLGLSFAQAIGCREFYLFGVDLGARDPNKHHSVDSFYEDGQLGFDAIINVPYAANFGGDVMTEMTYQWARQTMEMAIVAKTRGRLYFNCSDGCRIDNTTPRLSSTINLRDVPDKKEIIADILDAFPQYTKEMFEESWTKRNLRKRLDEFTDVMIEAVEGETSEHEDNAEKEPDKTKVANEKHEALEEQTTDLEEKRPYDLQFAMDMCRILIPSDPFISTETHYFRGSTLMAFALINYYYNRIPNEEQRAAFVQIVKEELIYQFERTKKRVRTFYDNLEGVESSDDEELIAPDEQSA